MRNVHYACGVLLGEDPVEESGVQAGTENIA
jgi:hypothetical protein